MDYRDMINQDFEKAPLTESQLGQQAGERSYNEQVPAVNQALKSGEPLRRQYSPEVNAQRSSDAEIYQSSQPDTETFKMENPQGNIFLKNLGPDGANSLVNAIINNDPQSHIQYMASRSIAENGVDGTKQLIMNEATGREPAGYSGIGLAAQAVSGAFNNLLPNAPDNYVTRPQQPTPAINPGQARPQQKSVVSMAAGRYAPIKDISTAGTEQVAANARANQAILKEEQQKIPQNAKTKMEAQHAINQAEIAGWKARYESELGGADYYKNYLKQNEEQLSDLMNKEYNIQPIDVNRVWDNTGSWQKLALIAGSGLLGGQGSNAGLQMIGNMVSNDIKAQENTALNQRSLIARNVEMMKALGMRQMDAIKASQAMIMKGVVSYQEFLKAGGKDDPSVLQNILNQEVQTGNLKLTDMTNKVAGTELGAEKATTQAKLEVQKTRFEREKANHENWYQGLAASQNTSGDISRMTSLDQMHIAKNNLMDVIKSSGVSPAGWKERLANGIGTTSNPELYHAMKQFMEAEVGEKLEGERGEGKLRIMMASIEPKLKDALATGKYNEMLDNYITNKLKTTMKFEKPALVQQELEKNNPELLQYNLKKSLSGPAERLMRESAKKRK